MGVWRYKHTMLLLGVALLIAYAGGVNETNRTLTVELNAAGDNQTEGNADNGTLTVEPNAAGDNQTEVNAANGGFLYGGREAKKPPKPAEPVGFAEPAETAKPAAPTKPAAPIKPAAPAKPAKPKETLEPEKPSGPKKPLVPGGEAVPTVEAGAGETNPHKSVLCPLKPVGSHPWLIRITPMMKLPNPPQGLRKRKIVGRRQAWRNWPQDDHGSSNRIKRKDPPVAGADDKNTSKIETAAPKPTVVRPTRKPSIKSVKNITRSSKVDLRSKLHGSLITPSQVLTTVAYENEWTTNTPLPEGYLSLIGYNTEDGCHQEQWGKEPRFHSKSAQFVINVGEFALIETYKPFNTKGDPFLFGLPRIPDFDKIDEVYDIMASEYGQKDNEKVTIYLFQDKADLLNGKTYEANKFEFIPWDVCRDFEIMKKVKGISLQARDNTFFCGEANKEWSKEKEKTVIKEEPLVGQDWFQGAPAVHLMNGTLVPLGHYIYRIGKTGNPRIFATFTKKIMELLQPEPEVSVYEDDLESSARKLLSFYEESIGTIMKI